VLPSSYNIPCRIENGNTIVFTMDRPEKVFGCLRQVHHRFPGMVVAVSTA
jgi:hypothetical protein